MLKKNLTLLLLLHLFNTTRDYTTIHLTPLQNKYFNLQEKIN
jgi:hypothetical protein